MDFKEQFQTKFIVGDKALETGQKGDFTHVSELYDGANNLHRLTIQELDVDALK